MTSAVVRHRYHVRRSLGVGGGGAVFEVDDLGMPEGQQRLALKALFFDEQQDAELLGLLRREFHVMATLNHPRIARVFDFGRLPPGCALPGANGRPGYFFTRELLSGGDLFERCSGRPVAVICRVFMLIAQALDVLHQAGMVHRDFKPANVIVDEHDQPHLIDFGLVRSEGAVSLAGTAGYLAPEVIRGEQADRRADLYAMGISLYQVLVGSLPERLSSGLPSALDWHLHGEPLSLRDTGLSLPPALHQLVLRLTQRDPDRRYPTASEVQWLLGRVLDGISGEQVAADLLRATSGFVPPAPGTSLTGPLGRLEELVLRVLAVPTRRRPDTSEPPFELGGRSLVAIVGEPGSGKSTILSALAWHCQLAEVEVLRGAFLPNDPRPYGPIPDLLSQLGTLLDTASPLAEEALDRDADRYAAFERVGRFLERASERFPLVLMLDGLEHADDETVSLLRFLSHILAHGPSAASPAQVLLLVAYPVGSALPEALGSPPTIELQPMTLEQVGEFVARAAGRVDGALAEAVFQHTGGNPQFLLDVAERLHSAGWPTHPDLELLSPPTSFEEAYRARWRLLEGDAQRVVSLLAVLGRPAQLRGIKTLLVSSTDPALELNESRLRLLLERLNGWGWLRRGPDGRWTFIHGAAASVVYGLLSTATKKRAHAAIFSLLSEVGGPDRVEPIRHALAAGLLDEVWTELPVALDQLRRIGSFRAGITLLQQASELLPAKGRGLDRERLSLWLGKLARRAGDHELALATLEPVKHQLLAVDATLERCHVLRISGRARQAVDELTAPIAAATDRDSKLRLLVSKAAALTVLDQHETVLELAEVALSLECTVGDPVARAELLGRKAWSLGYLQRFTEASTTFEQAVQAAQEAGARRVEADTLNRWAVVSWRQGHYEAVERRYGAALATMQTVGDVERAAVVRFNLGGFQLQRGHYGAALENLEASLRIFEGVGAPQSAASARCNLGQLQIELGLYEEARHSLQLGLEQMRAAGRRSGEALAGLLLALVAARQGQLDEARLGIGQAREIFLAVGQARDAADALLDLAEVELDARMIDEAERALQLAGSEVDLDELEDLAVRALVLRARLAAQRNAISEAQQQLATAMGRARTLEAPGALWRCHHAAYRLHAQLGEGDKAREQALLALGLLREMTANLPQQVLLSFWSDARRRELREAAVAPPTARPVAGRRAGRLSTAAGRRGIAMSAEDNTWLAETIPPQEGSALEERFYRLLEIYRQINSELDPERLLGVVMDTVVELTGAERGFLLLGPRADALSIEVTRNIDPQGEKGAYSRSIAERVFNSGRPIITVSAQNDPRFVDYASVHQMQLESVLCIPVHAQNRVAGVLYMESRFQSGRFTPEDQRLLMAFGDQVAIALTNARLYADNLKKTEQLERANAEIEALAEERGRLLKERTAQLEQVKYDLAETRRRLISETGRYGLIGASRPMLRIFELIERVAGTDVPVLIEGESGTGKEMVARAIHAQSAREARRLVSVNCAAIPENLLESELFGHVRGAFTGADRDRKGLFSTADGGTLFLDEIGDMPPRMQVDMLRALQEKTIRPVGGQKDLSVDVRVIAASNKPLTELVRQGTFREDLFYRLHVIRIELPPLRERTDDVPLLMDHFLKRICEQMGVTRRKLTRGAMQKLVSYHWPGNVRQLEHALLNAAVLGEGEVLDEGDFALESPRDGLPPRPATRPDAPPEASPASARDRKEYQDKERDQMLAALEQCNWNKSRAAEVLGMPRRTFYRRLKAYGIQ